MWLNEYHADFLARDRLAEARKSAARRHLIESLRRRPDGHWVYLTSMVTSLGRRLRALL